MRLKNHISEIVENQLKDNNPKCVKETFERLIAMGHAQDKAKKMIGAVLLEEIYYILKEKRSFNEKQYSEKLSMLPGYTGEAVQEEIEADSEDIIPQVPIRNENKIGRNDLCPCGSGKKYKKCCGS